MWNIIVVWICPKSMITNFLHTHIRVHIKIYTHEKFKVWVIIIFRCEMRIWRLLFGFWLFVYALMLISIISFFFFLFTRKFVRVYWHKDIISAYKWKDKIGAYVQTIVNFPLIYEKVCITLRFILLYYIYKILCIHKVYKTIYLHKKMVRVNWLL